MDPLETAGAASASPQHFDADLPVGTAGIWSERYRLAVLHKDQLIHLALFSAIFALSFIMWHFQGNTTDVKMFGRSALSWMVQRWSNDPSFGGNGNYTHGWIIPFVSLAIVYWRRLELYKATKTISWIGFSIVVLSLLMHYLGAKTQHPRLSLLGLIGLLWSVPFYLYGWQVAKYLMFPCAFLIYCIPLQFLDAATFKLKMFATIASAGTLNALGVDVIQSGADIIFKSDPSQKLNVADACSGLRSLLALSALTAVYGYLTMDGVVRKWLLFLSAIPLAMIGNVVRIVTVAVFAQGFNYQLGTGLVHDWSGYIVFAVAIGLMVVVGAFLNMNFKEKWEKWKTSVQSI